MALTADVVWFLLVTTLGAVALVVHALVVWLAIAPGSGGGVGWRLLALFVPPAAPVAAWRAGRRVAAILWAVVVAGYVAARVAFERT